MKWLGAGTPFASALHDNAAGCTLCPNKVGVEAWMNPGVDCLAICDCDAVLCYEPQTGSVSGSHTAYFA